jgi:hypothetical protein
VHEEAVVAEQQQVVTQVMAAVVWHHLLLVLLLLEPMVEMQRHGQAVPLTAAVLVAEVILVMADKATLIMHS